MNATAAVTNRDFAETIGLTHSQVSRLRGGHRLPSVPTMSTIERELEWPIGQQVRAREKGTYAADLEERLCRRYGKTPTEDDVTTSRPSS